MPLFERKESINCRESAGQLEQEKESLIDMLGNVNLNSELLRLGQGNVSFICQKVLYFMMVI